MSTIKKINIKGNEYELGGNAKLVAIGTAFSTTVSSGGENFYYNGFKLDNSLDEKTLYLYVFKDYEYDHILSGVFVKDTSSVNIPANVPNLEYGYISETVSGHFVYETVNIWDDAFENVIERFDNFTIRIEGVDTSEWSWDDIAYSCKIFIYKLSSLGGLE